MVGFPINLSFGEVKTGFLAVLGEAKIQNFGFGQTTKSNNKNSITNGFGDNLF